eukprot:jgi/Mesvir1/1539/Mv14522-RA.1
MASTPCYFHDAPSSHPCNRPRVIMLETKHREKGGLMYSVEHVCNPKRDLSCVSICAEGAHEIGSKHGNWMSLSSPACFVCKAPVELINIDSDLGKHLLERLSLGCPNTECDYVGLFESFSTHDCVFQQRRCKNSFEVDGKSVGCHSHVGGTLAPHKCHFDLSDPTTAFAQTSYMNDMLFKGLISKGVYELVMEMFRVPRQ